MADGRRLSRLEIRVIGGERRDRGARVTREGGSLVDEGIVQLARPQPGRQPYADPERLASRASGTEPARGRLADAPLQLGLARVEGITDRGIPRELVAGDRVELEQSAQERLRVVARKVAALDQSDRVREIGERQPVREARSVGALRRERGGDELARSSPAQAPATPQLLRSTHAAETTWRQSARRLRGEVETTQSAGAQAVIACLQCTPHNGGRENPDCACHMVEVSVTAAGPLLKFNWGNTPSNLPSDFELGIASPKGGSSSTGGTDMSDGIVYVDTSDFVRERSKR